jgi:aminopeptidase N
MALRELPRERDEQITGALLAAVTRATTAYIAGDDLTALQPQVERALRAGVGDTTRGYGIRKQHLDALIRVSRTPAALSALDALLDSARAAGEELRPPARWAIVTRLLEGGHPTAERRLVAETARDSTSDGRRRAFVAGAARPAAAAKRGYFARYFADTTLNEDWVTASLGAFNAIEHEGVTREFLVPALDSLGWIQRNRRIFFLGAWLGDFLGGQTSADALGDVRRYLERHPDLPRDLRLKILQAADELERTVRIRQRGEGRLSRAAREPRDRDLPPPPDLRVAP